MRGRKKSVYSIRKKGRLCLGLLILFLLFFIGAEFCIKNQMIQYTYFLNPLRKLECWFANKSNENLLDIFGLIWPTAIAITIFVLEVSGEFKYGVSLKQMVILSFDKRVIYIGAVIYLFLCPSIYFFYINNCWVLVLTCLCVSFVGLLVVFHYIFWLTRKSNIVKILQIATLHQLDEFFDGKKTQGSIQSNIESWTIFSMIEHVEYINAEDVRELIDVIVNILGEKDFLNGTGQLGEHTVFMTWVAHISEKFEFQDEPDVTRAVDLYTGLWGKIDDRISMDSNISEERKNKLRISYSVQLLLPFINYANRVGNSILFRVCSRMNKYKRDVLPYLLLYTEFRYWFINGEINDWFQNKGYRICEVLQKGYDGWDRNLAWELWVEWSQYNGERDDIGVSQFCDFIEDLEKIIRGDNWQIKSEVLSIAMMGGGVYEKN